MKELFKKVEILSFRGDSEKLTSILQNIGIVHLELTTNTNSKALASLTIQKEQLEKAILILKSQSSSTEYYRPEKKEVLSTLAKEIIALEDQRISKLQEIEQFKKQRLLIAPWGKVNLERIETLESNGIRLFFFVAQKNVFEKFDFGSLTTQIISEQKNKVFFVVPSSDKNLALPFETVPVPELSKEFNDDNESALSKDYLSIVNKLSRSTCNLSHLRTELVNTKDQLTALEAQNSYKQHKNGSILSLKGWFPESAEEKIVTVLEQEGIAYAVSKPIKGDLPPVMLKNRKFPKIFEAITKIFELPNYHEMDLTPFIAVFYPILFAYCLGDAGYGIILLIASVTSLFTFLKYSKNIAILGIILGAVTTITGVIKSGSVFGIPLIIESDNIILSYLSQFIIIPDSRDFVFNSFSVALMIGLFQILVGISLSIINKMLYQNFLASIPQIGKLLTVISLIWIFLGDIQDFAFFMNYATIRKTTLFAGIALIVFFHDMSTSTLKRAASSVLPLFFILTGLLGDVLSYVRLFALGVASSVLGLVVNQIGMQIMENGLFGVIIGIVFLIFGHTLNFSIALLGAFVHPLRLTFVEFYNNAQFQGGGKHYKPFKKLNIQEHLN